MIITLEAMMDRLAATGTAQPGSAASGPGCAAAGTSRCVDHE
jgi:hypothetical protein